MEQVQRRRRVPVLDCPDHRGSVVQGWGTFLSRGERYQRYRCRSRSGGTHYFAVSLSEAAEGRISRPGWARPPRCPKHATGRVVRFGSYGGGKAGRARQRYHCQPHCPTHSAAGTPCPKAMRENGKTGRWVGGCPNRPHSFTPPLARRWIEGHGFADACGLCEQPRGVHYGEPNAARHHSFTSATVAAGLIRLSGGDTYGEVGKWGLEERAGQVGTRAATSGKSAAKRRSNNAWHIAADWVECCSPVLYDPLDRALRERAIAERSRIDTELAAGLTLREPIIWIADEMPIGRGQDWAYMILVVAECSWPATQAEPLVRLRLARAMPDRAIASWLLVWDELSGPEGVWPDYLVSDNSAGLIKSARSRLGPHHRWVMSFFHLARLIRGAYTGQTPNMTGPASPPIEAHLALLTRGSSAFASVQAWGAWWDELGRLFEAEGRTPGFLDGRRRTYEPPIAAAIADLAGGLRVPLSTGANEVIQRTRLRRVFEGRGLAMTSIERTNSLLDLVVAREHGLLNNETEVARRLREDAHAHGGWTHPPRSISDPANPFDHNDRYKSLRDPTLPQRLVFERGLG